MSKARTLIGVLIFVFVFAIMIYTCAKTVTLQAKTDPAKLNELKTYYELLSKVMLHIVVPIIALYLTGVTIYYAVKHLRK